MKYTEELHWILDEIDGRFDTLEHQEAPIARNIAFVHSLGLKCDGVGWCRLDLSRPDANEILGEIERFCRENGWRARGYYTRKYAGTAGDWYEIEPEYFSSAAVEDAITVPARDGGTVSVRTICAYREAKAGPKIWGQEFFLPERFRDACLKHGIEGIDFCWARDKGKYAAEQYFHAYGTRMLPRMATDSALRCGDMQMIRAAGGWLPKIAAVFHELQQISLPDCYIAADLPEGGIACACLMHTYEYMGVRESEGGWEYFPKTRTEIDKYRLLIHRDTAEILLREKAIAPSALRPAPVMDEVPGGYTLQECRPVPQPEAVFMDEMLREYEALKASPRPVRAATERDALRALRSAKKERRADFGKALPKAQAALLTDTEFAVLAAYYAAANGGRLSDEYEFLPYERAVNATAGIRAEMVREELLDEPPQGVVFAGCPDGDAVLLQEDGTVVRFSHEAPEAVAQWPSLAQFFSDEIE